MIKYRCTGCGYIYDHGIGDAPGIKSATALEDLRMTGYVPIVGWEGHV